MYVVYTVYIADRNSGFVEGVVVIVPNLSVTTVSMKF